MGLFNFPSSTATAASPAAPKSRAEPKNSLGRPAFFTAEHNAWYEEIYGLPAGSVLHTYQNDPTLVREAKREIEGKLSRRGSHQRSPQQPRYSATGAPGQWKPPNKANAAPATTNAYAEYQRRRSAELQRQNDERAKVEQQNRARLAIKHGNAASAAFLTSPSRSKRDVGDFFPDLAMKDAGEASQADGKGRVRFAKHPLLGAGKAAGRGVEKSKVKKSSASSSVRRSSRLRS